MPDLAVGHIQQVGGRPRCLFHRLMLAEYFLMRRYSANPRTWRQMKACSCRPYPDLIWRFDDGGMRHTVAGRPAPIATRDGTAMIASLVPEATGAELFADDAESAMHPAEAALVITAGAERRREFAAARRCARRALAALGAPAVAVLPDADGAPVWPAGVVGSLTHCPGYRAAAAGRSETFRGLGIDAEPHIPLPLAVDDLILRAEERARLRTLNAARPHVRWDRLVFSAKEAVYKAWFPLTRRWLGFEDVSITVRLDGGFHADLDPQQPPVDRTLPERIPGRWLVGRGFVLAAAWIAQPNAPVGLR
jgi:4'-phosphopantetheinyl transferase EntD